MTEEKKIDIKKYLKIAFIVFVIIGVAVQFIFPENIHSLVTESADGAVQLTITRNFEGEPTVNYNTTDPAQIKEALAWTEGMRGRPATLGDAMMSKDKNNYGYFFMFYDAAGNYRTFNVNIMGRATSGIKIFNILKFDKDAKFSELYEIIKDWDTI